MRHGLLWLLLVGLLSPVSSLATEPVPPLGEDRAIGSLLGKQWALHDISTVAVEKVAQITGEDSLNKTQSRFGVWGTDLGSLAILGDTTYMFCGDTFSTETNGYWRSNVLFKIQDDDPSDGLTITGAVLDRNGNAKEILASKKLDKVEMTVIPTNIFEANGTLYCVYMSVAHWGDAGRWDCGHSGLARSMDGGENWEKLESIQWPGDSYFIQTANCQVDDTMYFLGIKGGRAGGAALMKVPLDQIESFDAYSYYVGNDEIGAPKWIQGPEGIAKATVVVPGPVGEISLLYNPYLGNFLLTYLYEPTYSVIVREGITPWGEWGQPVSLASGADYPSLYGGFMHPKYVEHNGKTFYFAMSQFFPIYNIMWMRATLP